MTPHLRSQVVRLLKNIGLRPSDPGGRPYIMFLAGAAAANGFATGIGISWWFNSHSRSAKTGLAALLIKSSSEFADCDQETASEVVLKTLQEICIDRNFFIVEEIILAKKENLFECIAHAADYGADLVLSAIISRLQTAIGRCCTVFAIPRFIAQSFSIRSQGVHLVARGDVEWWNRSVNDGYMLDDWWSSQDQSYGRADSVFSLPDAYDSLIVVEGTGTRRGTRFSSIMKSRVFITVIFSVSSAAAAYPYHKSAASSSSFCVQYPHRSDLSRTMKRVDCDPFVPYYVDEIQLNSLDIKNIQDWYEKLSCCVPAVASRIEKSAHFFNLGMNAKGYQAYINFFVALDALLGRRGAVEASILEGLVILDFASVDIHRAKWLFELRSELVHGGSRYMEEWPKYPRYLKFFESDPLHDVQRLARDAVLRAPKYLT